MMDHSCAYSKYNEEDIIKMLKFLIDKMSEVFTGRVFFRQIVGITMGTNCASLLANIALYLELRNRIHTIFALGQLASLVNVRIH